MRILSLFMAFAMSIEVTSSSSNHKNKHEGGSLVLPTCARPHVIAHRGACGYLPEHTLQAYRLAIDLGVEYIEPDLVLTRDGHLICRHDVDLSETTDVAQRPEFRERRRNVTLTSVDLDDHGKPKQVKIQGFFSFDFTLKEIKTLKAKQRLSQRSSTYNGLFEVPTFEEVIDMVREAEIATGRRIGIYAELKEPYFFRTYGFDVEAKLIESLEVKGLLSVPNPPPGPDVPAPIIIQCFDHHTLRSLSHSIPTVPLVQLLLAPTTKDDTIAHYLGREGVFGQLPLSEIATYASGIGPQKTVFTALPPEAARAIVDDAHALGMAVHPWTFRRETTFVDRSFKEDSDHELRFFYECLNVDALFVEFPDQASMVIERILSDDLDDGIEKQQQNVTINAAAAAVGSGSRANVLLMEELVGGEGVNAATRTCLQLRKARGCSLEGPLRNPSYVSPWLRRKAF